MKAVWTVTLLLFTCALGHAADSASAYQALRVVGGSDQGLLNHVIQVQGTHGESQPLVWSILVDDQNARGGVRELEVSKGRVISEHTPMRGYAGTGVNAVMDFKKLNLDSQGAFTIANQEASKRHVGFDSVDYMLRSDEQTGAPVWVLKLIDSNHVNVGVLYIAADNGAVLRAEGFGPVRTNGRTTYVPPVQPVVTPTPAYTTDSTDPNDIPPDERIGYKINRGIHRVGGTLQEFFTGKRTIDKDYDNGAQ